MSLPSSTHLFVSDVAFGQVGQEVDHRFNLFKLYFLYPASLCITNNPQTELLNLCYRPNLANDAIDPLSGVWVNGNTR